MANKFLTPDIIAKEALVLLESNMVIGNLVDRQYEASFTGAEKVGSAITIRKREGAEVLEFAEGGSTTEQEMTETAIPLVIEKHFDQTIKLTSKDMTLELQDFSEQILAPNLLKFAEKIDSYMLSKVKDVPNFAGNSASAPSALPASIGDMAQVNKTANDLKLPFRPRHMVMSTELEANLLSVPAFAEADKRGDAGTAMREASVGRLLSFDSYMAQNVDTSVHTSGTATAGAVNGAVAKGSVMLPVDGFGAGETLLAGDVIIIAGIGAFVVKSDITLAGGAGNVELVYPITKDVADNAVVSVYDGGGNDRESHGVIFHPNAFALVTIPLALPMDKQGAIMEYRGLRLRVYWGYDQTKKTNVLSIDCLATAKCIDPRLAAQIVKDI